MGGSRLGLAARIRERAEAVLAYDRASADRLPDGLARRIALADVVCGDPGWHRTPPRKSIADFSPSPESPCSKIARLRPRVGFEFGRRRVVGEAVGVSSSHRQAPGFERQGRRCPCPATAAVALCDTGYSQVRRSGPASSAVSSRKKSIP